MATVVEASIRSSPLFTVRNLNHLQRDAGDASYSQFIDLIGDRQVEFTYSVDRDTHLMMLELVGVTTSEEEAIQFVFPDMSNTYLYCEQAIVTGRNAVLNDLNRKILQRLDGEEVKLHSVTHLSMNDHGCISHFHTEEFLHSLKSLVCLITI